MKTPMLFYLFGAMCISVDGQWANWGVWATCSTTCGDGINVRSRSCSNPTPAHGGLDCHGNSTEHRQCNISLCPGGTWSDWSSWSNCSTPCGNGFMTRNRQCVNPVTYAMGAYCVGSDKDVSACKSGHCPGFNARMSGDNRPTTGQTIPFTIEEVDIGGGYDPSTSTYTVPLTGIYELNWRLQTYMAGAYKTKLVVNNQSVDVQYINNADIDQVSTFTRVNPLNTGDTVLIRVIQRTSNIHFWSSSGGYNTFSAWMLS